MKPTTSDLEREHVRAALSAIVARNNGLLNPRQILDEARNTDNVLHRYFEWDDSKAGDAYRLAQVGVLVRHVRLTIVRPDPVTREVRFTTTREYQSRPSMRQASGGYESVESILSDEHKRAELLAQVLRELNTYRQRYAELSELQPVWIVVDELTADHAPQSLPANPTGDESRQGAAG